MTSNALAEAFIVTFALSADIFVVSFAYGSNNRIKIPFLSACVINIAGSLILALSLLAGTAVSRYIPESAANILGFAILFILGTYRLFESLRNRKIRKDSEAGKARRKTRVRSLSILETFSLAAALSIDELAAGFGEAMMSVNIPLLLALSLISDFVVIYAGFYMGEFFARKSRLDLSWLGGSILMASAVLMFFIAS